MAKIKLGALAGQVSGSIGCYTFSHNRGGPYIRLRNIADRYSTQAYTDAHARLATVSGNWKQLTEDLRKAWTSWASANPVLDSLGEKRPLTGAQAYSMLGVRAYAMGHSLTLYPPASGNPTGLTSLTNTAVIAGDHVVLTFAPTPLGSGLRLWYSGCYVDSIARNFVKKDLRWIGTSADNLATGADIGSEVVARLGALTPGQYLCLEISVANSATGQISLPVQTKTLIS